MTIWILIHRHSWGIDVWPAIVKREEDLIDPAEYINDFTGSVFDKGDDASWRGPFEVQTNGQYDIVSIEPKIRGWTDSLGFEIMRLT